ncbi:hypothetical protein GS492_09745 [Rhodococcus hoagii]|nr:hypothetical protein [Prescottella equi]
MDNVIDIVTLAGAALTAMGLIVMARQLAVARSSNGGALSFETRRGDSAATVSISAIGPGSWHNVRCEVFGSRKYTPVDPFPVSQLLCTDEKHTWTVGVPDGDEAELWFLVLWDEPFLGKLRASAMCGPVTVPPAPGTALWQWHWKPLSKTRSRILTYRLGNRFAPLRFLGAWKAEPRVGNAAGRGPRAQLDALRGVEHPIRPGGKHIPTPLIR